MAGKDPSQTIAEGKLSSADSYIKETLLGPDVLHDLYGQRMLLKDVLPTTKINLRKTQNMKICIWVGDCVINFDIQKFRKVELVICDSLKCVLFHWSSHRL